MQEVFLKAVKGIDGLKDSAGARAWLMQIARRTCIDSSRRRRPMQQLDESQPARHVGNDGALAEWVARAVGKLPEQFAHVVALYYLDGRTCAGVAEALGVTEAAVRQRLVRARSMLHDLLREDQEQ